MRYGSVCLLFFASTAFAAYTVSPNHSDPSGGGVVQIRNLGVVPLTSCTGDCPPLQISFGGVPATKITTVPLGYNTSEGWDVVVPPHAEGAVTITIGYGAFVLEKIERQFAYDVERESLFVPVAVDALPGTNGTLWSSELWVHNDGDHDVALEPAASTGLIGVVAWQGDRYIVKANSARRVPLHSEPYGLTAVLYPPRGARAQLSYDLRLLDRNHPGSGTSVPVVRQEAMQRAKLTMLNVPADGTRARRRLRVFAGFGTYIVRVYDLDSGQEIAERTLTTPPWPTDAGPPNGAFTLEDDVADGTKSGATRLRVEVEQAGPGDFHYFWAMISVTDNATQQVTIISPQ
jgi:hypothetical protein